MRSVKPIPSPPMRTLGCRNVRKRWQAKVAKASSEPCMQLDIRTAPSTRMMYSLARRTSFNAVPSGETVWTSSSKGFTDVMLQQVDYWTSGAGFHLFALIALTENAAGDKKGRLQGRKRPCTTQIFRYLRDHLLLDKCVD